MSPAKVGSVMQSFVSVDDVLDYAIHREEDAWEFYSMMAEDMSNPAMRQVFLEFALEEQGHRAKLLQVKSGELSLIGFEEVKDLKIGDYLVDVKAEPGMTYQQALIVAMKREKSAFKLYSHLAQHVASPGLKSLFLSLANEEAKHKLRFELEYDEAVLKEN
jgi:rubrerythrin